MERIEWTDPHTKKTHAVLEEGHLFRWTCSYEDEEGKPVALDYGLVPGGVFVAVLHLANDHP